MKKSEHATLHVNLAKEIKRRWHDPLKRDKLIKQAREISRELWKDEEYRKKTIEGQIKGANKEEVKKANSERIQKRWDCDSEYREKMKKVLERARRVRWNKEGAKERMSEAWKNHKSDCQCLCCKVSRKEVLNHKVVKVERLLYKKDTYDLTTAKNHNFPTAAGVFVHNSDPMYAEFRTISIMTPDARRLTSKYGTSILLDALPIYKRLRLAEDSVLMSRIGKGIMRYIYKVAIGGENSNPDAVSSLIDEYVAELKRARAFDNDDTNPNYQDRFGPLSALEDIILPVWGDVNNLQVDKIGGEVDIRWIKDIDELRNQLACALKIPLQILGGYQNEIKASLGASSLERLDIRFARQSKRIQRALINGITRLIQIHLAYQGIDPDLSLFEVHMAEGSSAEEEELKDALDKGVDVASKLADLYEKMLGPDVDKRAVLDYMNKKFLKLSDVDLEEFILQGRPEAFRPERTEDLVPGIETPSPIPGAEGAEEENASPGEGGEAEEFSRFEERKSFDADVKSSIPLRENIAAWEAKWKDTKIKIKPVEEK